MKQMKRLPERVTKTGGNHQTATDRAKDIHGYVDKAVSCLDGAAAEENGHELRGGYLRQADDYLETVIRFARCAQNQLRIDQFGADAGALDD